MTTETYENPIPEINLDRRRMLTTATSITAGIGIAGVAIPFVKSWNPSAKARVAGASIEVNISKLEPGRMISVKWRGKPVWILNRTKINLGNMSAPDHRDNLRDPDSLEDNQPDYARNEYRSIRADIFVTIGLCTHLGCIPVYTPQGREDSANALYFCPCHGSKFDLAGRVFKGVPAPTNLIIPPYLYLNDDVINIGEDG